MERAQNFLYLIIVSLGVGLVLFCLVALSFGQGMPSPYVLVGGGSGTRYMPSGSMIPGGIMPYSFGGNTGHYWHVVSYMPWSACAGVGGGCASCYSNFNGWSTNTYWQSKNAGGGCTAYYDRTNVVYADNGTSSPSASYDYDGDGANDVVDTNNFNPLVTGSDRDGDGIDDAVDPWPDDPNKPGTAKFINKLTFTNKTTGVTYKKYQDVADSSSFFWTSSDGSALPSSFPQDSYRLNLNIYADDNAAGKLFSDISSNFSQYGGEQVRAGQGGTGSTSTVPQVTGGETASSTSPGKATGGDAGTYTPSQGSTNDYKEMFDYLQGIQRNTKATADNLINIDNDLQKIKQNQSSLGVTPSGQQSSTDMSGTISAVNAVKGSVDATKGAVDATKGAVDTVNSTLESIKEDLENTDHGEAVEGDTSGMEDNSDLSEEENITKVEAETESLTTFMDNILYSANPITAIVLGSGVDDSGGSSSVSVSWGGGGFSLDFAECAGALDTIGVFFVGFCGLAGLVEFLRG